MLELHVKDTEVTSGTVPISWCTDKATIAKLRDHGYDDPKIVFVIAPVEDYHPSKEQRCMAPFRDGLAYLSFRRSGPQRIHAIVCSGDAYWLRRSCGYWDQTVLRSDGSGFREDWLHAVRMAAYREELAAYETAKRGLERERADRESSDGRKSDGSDDGSGITEDELRELEDSALELEKPSAPSFEFTEHIDERSATLDVEVPKEAFAKTPPKWEQAWVNHYFRSKPVDQCAYRRRRILAWTPFLQPLGFALLWLVRLLMVVVGWLIGLRGMTYAALYRPMRYETPNVWSDTEGSIFIGKDGYGNSFWKTLIRLPFMPAIYLVSLGLVALIAAGLADAGWMAWPGWHLLWMAFLGSIAVMLLLAVLVGLTTLVVTGVNAFRDREIEIAPLTEDEEAYLVCGGSPRFGVGDLPRSRRTVRLRYLALKAKVCQPFSD